MSAEQSVLTLEALQSDNRLMVTYLLARGKPVPLEIGQRVLGAGYVTDTGDAVRLDLLDHALLCQAVAPATPMSLRYLAETDVAHGHWWGLGVPLVRQLMLTALASIAVFALAGTSSAVTRGSGDIFESSGLDTAINEAFLLSAASIGASFAALFKANLHVAAFTFEPRFAPTYWARLLLGLIAGLVLAEMIPLGDGSSDSLSKPVLALLGGFSAELVYGVLTRLVSALNGLTKQASTSSPVGLGPAYLDGTPAGRQQEPAHPVATASDGVVGESPHGVTRTVAASEAR